MEQTGSYKGFKELSCRKEGRELRKQMIGSAKLFPAEEKYLLTSQMKRASRSVAANIAEGHGEFTYADTRHFFIQ